MHPVMSRLFCPGIFLTVIMMSVTTTAAAAADQTTAQPPVAKKSPHLTEIHGLKLTDDYFWLREKSDPEVKAYVEAENAYTDSVMKPTEELQKKLGIA